MAKLTYVQAVINRLKAQKTGITNNATAWTGQPDTPATTQAHIDALEAADAEILALETTLSQKRTALKTLVASKEAVANTIELRIKGIHASTPTKWLEYGIEVPSTGASTESIRPVPEKGIVRDIIDDYDGIGFIIQWDKLAKTDVYEIERGVASNATDTNSIPSFTHLATVRKTKYTDDDVEKGTRYFYRVRGINARGAGEWSEPVSKVQ